MNKPGKPETKLGRHVRTVRVVAHKLRRRFKRAFSTFSASVALQEASLWQRLDVARYRVVVWLSRRGPIAVTATLFLLIGITAIWIPTLQETLGPYLSANARLDSLRSLLLTLGGALIGAAAIVSSLVLFAMQVNVERMPHGLFKRLSADGRLLGAFAGTFVLAILVTFLSQVATQDRVGAIAFGAFWVTVLVLALFLYGYRRALILINPVQQLRLVVDKTRQDLCIWARRAKRAAPLLESKKTPRPPRNDPHAPQHDLGRVVYFQINSGWTDRAKQGVRYAVAFAHRYAEQGDHEVSAAAMDAIIAINSAYVETKGKTFFAQQLLLDASLTSDGFINYTLEHLRQNARIGIARGDEQQIEQTLQAMTALVRTYLTIDYASPYASKSHAHLAAAYLSGAVEQVVPHNMPDVLMEGLRLMGQCAGMLLAAEGPQGVTTLTQKIGTISCVGVAREDYRPVTQIGVEQLANLSFELLRTRSREVGFAAKEIRGSMELIAKLFMALPDSPAANTHSTYLAPYYSATSTQALTIRLTQLVNAIANAAADDADARRIIHNFEKWADGMYETEKDLLLHALTKRSQFTFDIIHWIKTVTMLLLALSNADACDEHTREELRRHAIRLISVLSWVPDDEGTIKFVETFQMTETLFEAAADAHRRGRDEIAESIGDSLLSWMFNGGQYNTGWGILEHAAYGLATFALLDETGGRAAKLREDISRRLEAGGLPDQEIRDRAAREIRSRAGTLHRAGHWGSAIERGMSQADHEMLQPLLEEIANLISPGTAGDAIHNESF